MASNQLKLIDAAGLPLRLLLVLLLLLAIFGAWRAANWYMGSEIALSAPVLPEGGKEAAETAVQLAPADPLAHWSLGTLVQREITAGALTNAISEYRRAVSLSPRDFRLWVDLGRALEQAGDFDASERALRRGLELAPFYSWPHWHLGNFLVRRGRYAEGFKELRAAAEADPSKRGAIFDLVWAVYGGDTRAVRDVLGDTPAVQAGLANYLLGRGRMDEALQVWSGLSAEAKKENFDVGKALVDALLQAKHFRAALALSRDLSIGKTTPEVGKISNGSFEQAVSQTPAGYFEWRVPSNQQVQAALDSGNPRAGTLSLRLNFNAQTEADVNITQAVAVEPNTNYQLQFYVRANNLRSASTTIVQVLGADGKVLAESAPVAAGKSDWQQATLTFKTPPEMDGITLRISRPACTGEGGVCPIFGTIWYDDFNLQLAGR